jgi:hypothetical protein
VLLGVVELEIAEDVRELSLETRQERRGQQVPSVE